MKKAATVLLVRDTPSGMEFLLLERSKALQVLGGYWVFPGGKLDESDQGDRIENRMLEAAIREVFEETGLRLQKECLIPFARWQTPVGIPVRFDTYFYIARWNSQSVAIDGSEIVNFQWLSSRDALKAHQEGLAPMMPPTVVSLIKIGRFDRLDDALDYYNKRPTSFYLPKIEEHNGTTVMVYNQDDGYQKGALVGGIDRCVWKDSHWEYQTNIAE
ncbi:MAG: NUDIX hydrolase [Cellvibrionales bacterium]|nr:NUDIX hydrolase [Cellvibrionales bacterium]